MEIIAKPTSVLSMISGTPVRLWDATTELGARCTLFVAAVAVDTKSENVAEFEESLGVIPTPERGDFEHVKQSARKSLRNLWDYPLSREQHRDAIRIFLMGWMESAIARRDLQAIRDAAPEYQKIAAPDWVPDHTWIWWSMDQN